ncbi:unnamed protein product [Cuscuta europaea]|nr:unnamed protein product [Cuscuta europaea]
MFSNLFSGELPPSLANCSSLTRLRVQNNKLIGSIPSGFGLLPDLTFMDVSGNNFSGALPEDFGNALSLEFLNISENQFNVELPGNIWSAHNLKIFSASYSSIGGKIPDFKGCGSVYKIELEGNNLTGEIPSDVQLCEKLISLNVRRNSLTGTIPWEISSLLAITVIDLSHNLLTGRIPSNFGNIRTLESFNVSYNRLTGPLPSGQVFSSLHSSSFAGNDGLCGTGIHKTCQVEPATGTEIVQSSKKSVRTTFWILTAAIGVSMLVLIAVCRCLQANYRFRFPGDRKHETWELVAYRRLNFTAEDVLEYVGMSNKILGAGSSGTVYKVEMPGDEIIAVKKLHNLRKDTTRRIRGVLSEVEVLGQIRHKNIVRLLGCCSNKESAMLLYEYMPNGNLEDFLHCKSKSVSDMAGNWRTRYKIALGIAQGISYLHHDCDPVIIHRDLKPNNILLDSDYEAKVADFGVAKLYQDNESMSIIAGSYGYIAPEYAYSLQVDVKSDIYSYGVMLLEIVTGRRSMEAEFGEGSSIVDWVRNKLKAKEDIKDFLDKDNNISTSYPLVWEEMMLLFKIALVCTCRNPADRPSMRDVVSMLSDVTPKTKSQPGGDSGCDALADGGGGSWIKT